ncbi:hypothetical protein BV898_19871 [Hypsibius exemplaris]|uniref:CCHC-type domain-containing protein n=1 Tax=Hypsibius exemplaris TaxID=2072580 RepID=A0A9X6NJQ9_HYPEX|nr:hypothetical protein BV898_19871 [Hypsibius exemplaris]
MDDRLSPSSIVPIGIVTRAVAKRIMTGKRGRKAKNAQQQKRANTTDTSTPSAPLNTIQPDPYAHHFTAIYGQLQRISDEVRNEQNQPHATQYPQETGPTSAPGFHNMPHANHLGQYVSPLTHTAPTQQPLPPPPLAPIMQVFRPPPHKSLRFPVVNDRLLKLLQQPNAYVSLSDLLPENRSFDSAESTQSRSSRDASPSGKKGKPIVDSFGSWLEAFTVLQFYRAYYFPDLAIPLIAYGNIIRRMARQPGNSKVFLEYDRRFRERMAAPESETLEWHATDATLLSEVEQSIQPESDRSYNRKARLCYHCSSPDHFSDKCPSNPSNHSGATRYPANRPAPLRTDKPYQRVDNPKPFHGARNEPCREYNAGGCTDSPYCPQRLVHSCNVCLSKDHRADYHTTGNNPR